MCKCPVLYPALDKCLVIFFFSLTRDQSNTDIHSSQLLSLIHTGTHTHTHTYTNTPNPHTKHTFMRLLIEESFL